MTMYICYTNMLYMYAIQVENILYDRNELCDIYFFKLVLEIIIFQLCFNIVTVLKAQIDTNNIVEYVIIIPCK